MTGLIPSGRLRLPLVEATQRDLRPCERRILGLILPAAPRATGPAARVRVVPLGGAGEIGKNMYVVESDGRMVVIDCGITFPKNDQDGRGHRPARLLLRARARRRPRGDRPDARPRGPHRGGAVPAAGGRLSVPPFYGRRFTLALLRPKLGEHKLKNVPMHDVEPGEQIRGRPVRPRDGPRRRTRSRTRARSPRPATWAP